MPFDADWDRAQLQYENQPPAQQVIVDAPPSSLLLKGTVCFNVHGTAYGFLDECVLRIRQLRQRSETLDANMLSEVKKLEEAIISGDLDFIHEVLTEMYEDHRVPELGWADASVEVICATVKHDLEAADIRMQFWRFQGGLDVTLGWTQDEDYILSVSSLPDSWAQVQVFENPYSVCARRESDPYVIAREIRDVAIRTMNARKGVI